MTKIPRIRPDGEQSRIKALLSCFMAFILPFLIVGCTPSYEGFLFKSNLREANDFFNQGNYRASLNKYEQMMSDYPESADRVLFEMGVIYAHPENKQKDYEKSLECFQKLLKDYPESRYRQNSMALTSLVKDAMNKENRMTAQEKQIETVGKELQSKGNEVILLKKRIEALEKKALITRTGPADRILVLKKERLLMLISKDQVLKTYKIALGKDPNGPKEREGDNKTPEGTYIIDSRNRDSKYHLSLHISYPNERDKNRAKKMGVSPGGNIMIHGIKNGFSWIGDFHRGFDWTNGCIAVTDEEIEEIARLVPNGTTVDIRP
ncbi:L,D-transpeptidase family protein [Syntrophus buswellii]|uniref:L,D-transpeptidase family protein n=1 Tax=Syntrophus buswellii TaxID=43774 RepID=UPI0038D35D50